MLSFFTESKIKKKPAARKGRKKRNDSGGSTRSSSRLAESYSAKKNIGKDRNPKQNNGSRIMSAIGGGGSNKRMASSDLEGSGGRARDAVYQITFV